MGDKKEKARKKSFTKGLQAEFNKIIWPDKETLAKQTVATFRSIDRSDRYCHQVRSRFSRAVEIVER